MFYNLANSAKFNYFISCDKLILVEKKILVSWRQCKVFHIRVRFWSCFGFQSSLHKWTFHSNPLLRCRSIVQYLGCQNIFHVPMVDHKKQVISLQSSKIKKKKKKKTKKIVSQYFLSIFQWFTCSLRELIFDMQRNTMHKANTQHFMGKNCQTTRFS